ncbi:MAG: hypothetical protein RBR43_06995 [Desulfuromonadaceae bacterium]|nr:hypothetical protein [Desulfuromonas sp.]MDY0185604.1 hypothetical protein [Desulfuromonadaceae bacterium]
MPTSDLISSRNLGTRIKRRLNALIAPAPPELKPDYTAAEYQHFMKQELLRATPAYARGRMVVRGYAQNLLPALEQSSVVLGFLHHGSWILIGGAMRYLFDVPYTVIASRRNLPLMGTDEAEYWQHIHKIMADYYGTEIFYTDQTPRKILNWLKRTGSVLGVALDVREHEQYPTEHEILFNGGTLWVQTGPAKLARVSRSVIVPCSICYVAEHRVHELTFHAPVEPLQHQSDAQVTQHVFSALEHAYIDYPRQEFHDLMGVFSHPYVG